MKKNFLKQILSLLFIFSLPPLTACVSAPPVETAQVITLDATLTPTTAAAEAAVVRLNLAGPLEKPTAEISGLTWAGDWLILLPQYPDRFDSQLFRLSRTDLTRAIDEPQQILEPQAVKFISAGLEKTVAGFEGFEAIATNGQDAYLTIETHSAGTKGYLVKGTWQADFSQLTLDAASLTEIPSQMNISNSSYESLLVFGKRIVTLYEANGANINTHPLAEMFDLSLANTSSLNFPRVEYRITDATEPDENGEFWAINYFFPGDLSKLDPADDPIAQTYGKGSTHANSPVVERLVAFQFTEEGIVLAEKAPIQLQLLPDEEARNWEGLVQLDQIGFLMATDKFPQTWLAFVAYP